MTGLPICFNWNEVVCASKLLVRSRREKPPVSILIFISSVKLAFCRLSNFLLRSIKDEKTFFLKYAVNIRSQIKYIYTKYWLVYCFFFPMKLFFVGFFYLLSVSFTFCRFLLFFISLFLLLLAIDIKTILYFPNRYDSTKG